MKIVISVIGKDNVGILAGVSGKCAECGINIIDVSQSVLQDMFCMIMICDISSMNIKFGEFSEIISQYGKEKGLSIHAMHEDLFNSMHKI
ncbi:MAG: ACT domain-containing protein [Acutalibacteraceae bacterium]|nr:ACT domain-containing protein [Acutalibacteraceae bacterium]